MNIKKTALIISCEHGVNTIPKPYTDLFAPHQETLNTHRGIDFGALACAQYLHQHCGGDLVLAEASRLLIDCNRSLNHSHCFSEITESLPDETKQNIINRYYLPYRNQVNALIKQHINRGHTVLHLSIHSFTPIMNDLVRTADIGLLYDPRREPEKRMAGLWQKELKQQAPEYRVRMNYPYRGISDGLTSAMRKQYKANDYIGIEVESNQALTQEKASLTQIKKLLTASLTALLSMR